MVDLKTVTAARTEREAQVCIIGSGTAGIFLANLLCKQGIGVIMLDAGEEPCKSPLDSEEQCEQRGLLYRGADSGRAFGLGGTSTLWGGQMIPLSRSDFESRPLVNFDSWPIDYAEVAKYFDVVAREVGLGGIADRGATAEHVVREMKFPSFLAMEENFELRLSSWIPFGQRNFALAHKELLKQNTNLELWLNSPVVSICESGQNSGHINEVVAKSTNGRTLIVRPELVVVSAGALESTRLLLAYDHATGGAITQGGAPLGRYFADHLSVPCARFKCRDWKKFNQQVAPIFDRGLMRTPRLELSKSAQEEHKLSSAFAHITFSTKGQTGFDLVRSILRRRQGEQVHLKITPGLFISAIKDIASMAYWRYFYNRLWIPREAELTLQVDIEQLPNRESRLYLSDEFDRLKRRRLIIDWQITPDDVKVVRQVADLAIAEWKNSSLHECAEIGLEIPEALDSFTTPYDVYHPTGTLRMGKTSEDSVVDGNMRLWAADNCYVTTTAVFPSSGSANPGMTHLALTARLADHISRRLGSQ